MNRSQIDSMAQALGAALLFGASAPLAKLLLGEIEPIPLVACLYLGSGLGLLLVRVLSRWARHEGTADARETSLARNDLPWLAGAILAAA
jgi:hypothetical protein